MEENKFCYNYPHPSVTTDCVIFGFDGTKLRVLLVQRGIEPYKGRWAFPGGFMKIDESAEQCALRELREETGLEAEVYPAEEISQEKLESEIHGLLSVLPSYKQIRKVVLRSEPFPKTTSNKIIRN